MKFPVYLWVPKSGEKGFPRSSPHTVPAIIVIRVSSSLLLTLLTAIPRMLLLVLLRAAYSAPQAPFDIESRNRTRRADPAAINERRRPPAITSRSVNKQTIIATTTRRRGNQQSHIKLISTLESQRRNCYFAWNRSTRPCTSYVHIGVYAHSYTNISCGQVLLSETTPWFPLCFFFGFCDKFWKLPTLFLFLLCLAWLIGCLSRGRLPLFESEQRAGEGYLRG